MRKVMHKETGIVTLPQMYVVFVVQFKDGIGMSLEYMRVIYQIQHRCTSLVKGTAEGTHYKGETYNFKLYVWS
jgi:hypothetical protein